MYSNKYDYYDEVDIDLQIQEKMPNDLKERLRKARFKYNYHLEEGLTIPEKVYNEYYPLQKCHERLEKILSIKSLNSSDSNKEFFKIIKQCMSLINNDDSVSEDFATLSDRFHPMNRLHQQVHAYIILNFLGITNMFSDKPFDIDFKLLDDYIISKSIDKKIFFKDYQSINNVEGKKHWLSEVLYELWGLRIVDNNVIPEKPFKLSGMERWKVTETMYGSILTIPGLPIRKISLMIDRETQLYNLMNMNSDNLHHNV